MCLAAMVDLAAAQDFSVPSGQSVTLKEAFFDETPGALWLRLRFVAPRIGAGAGSETVDAEAAAVDMDHLCDAVALPLAVREGLEPERIVVSLADRDMPFGSRDPEATQFFGQYRPDGLRCIWEEF